MKMSCTKKNRAVLPPAIEMDVYSAPRETIIVPEFSELGRSC